MASWGPGPEIAKRFREKTGVLVEFQDAGDAGLILEKLKLFPVDVVVGLDELSLPLAQSQRSWRADAQSKELFTAIDQAPLAFVYRKGEIAPPISLQDLLDKRFDGAIALEDPRTSTPGLQFLMWVVNEMGEDRGFEYLKALKPNLHSVSPSWSGAYGAFTKKQAKLVLSYQTSPLYHVLEEKDDSYEAATFEAGQPVQVEYAGVPGDCARCDDAASFVRFLLEDETQKLISRKNFMLPAVLSAKEHTPFSSLPTVKTLKLNPSLMTRRSELFEKWRKLGL